MERGHMIALIRLIEDKPPRVAGGPGNFVRPVAAPLVSNSSRDLHLPAAAPLQCGENVTMLCWKLISKLNIVLIKREKKTETQLYL